MSKYTKFWAEVVSVGSWVLYFETPSLQAWATVHPGTKFAGVIAILLALGLKSSPFHKS